MGKLGNSRVRIIFTRPWYGSACGSRRQCGILSHGSTGTLFCWWVRWSWTSHCSSKLLMRKTYTYSTLRTKYHTLRTKLCVAYLHILLSLNIHVLNYWLLRQGKRSPTLGQCCVAGGKTLTASCAIFLHAVCFSFDNEYIQCSLLSSFSPVLKFLRVAVPQLPH